MSKLWTIVVVILLLGPAEQASAQTNERASQLVRDYVAAYNDKDETRQKKIWTELKSDPSMLKYIQDNHRHEYILFKYRQIEERIDSIQNQYGSGSSTGDETRRRRRTPRIRSSAGSDSVSSGSSGSNRPNAQRLSNSNRPPNKVTRSTSNNRLRRTNRDTARGFSNQNRARSLSNQSRLRSGR